MIPEYHRHFLIAFPRSNYVPMFFSIALAECSVGKRYKSCVFYSRYRKAEEEIRYYQVAVCKIGVSCFVLSLLRVTLISSAALEVP